MRALRQCLVILFFATTCMGHDMWMVEVGSGADKKICSRIGEKFPASVNSVTSDRVRTFKLHAEEGEKKLEGKLGDKEFCASVGTVSGVVEMVIQPRLNSLPPARFAEFAKGEGLTAVIESQSKPRTDATVDYLYSRYSKALVGQPGKMTTKRLGHILEIVPEGDPASLKPGEALNVRVYFLGKPLADAQIAAIPEGSSGEAFDFEVKTRTDGEGKAALRLTKGGLWYARMIYTLPSSDPEFQWHHFFCTFTFRVAAK